MPNTFLLQRVGLDKDRTAAYFSPWSEVPDHRALRSVRDLPMNRSGRVGPRLGAATGLDAANPFSKELLGDISA